MLQQINGRFRAVEFFAGLGGFAAAWPEVAVVRAVDINQLAAKQYGRNFDHPYLVREIESLSQAEIASWNANLWWMSPPCQPYSVRGSQRDLEDPRARSLIRLIDLIGKLLPEYLVLENVLGFATSAALEQLLAKLSACGYQWQSIQLCPTQFGWPNRRPRFYLLASQIASLCAWRPLPIYNCQLTELLEDAADAQDCAVASDVLEPVLSAIDRVDLQSDKPAACFASSYGRALINSGSYLQLSGGGFRRFSPREVARLLGFPDCYAFEEQLSIRQLWKLFGNSLSLVTARYVLSQLPGGPSSRLPWY